MGKVCNGSLLEDWSEAWNTPAWPPPVSCLQILVLDAGPCAVLLVTCPLYVCYLLRHLPEKHPLCFHFTAKMVCSAVLAVVCSAQCFLQHHSGHTVYLAVYAAWAAVSVMTMALAALEHSRDQPRSFYLFVFWLVAMSNSVLLLVMAISREDYDNDFQNVLVLILRCLFTTSLFLINCFADHHGSLSTYTSPEAVASPLSWLTFTWLNGLIWRGFKKPLADGDMLRMMLKDTSAVVGERFHACLDTRASQRNEHTAGQSKPGVRDKNSSFSQCLVQTFLAEMCVSHCGTVLIVASNLVIPFIIGWMIEFTSHPEEPTWHGYIYLLVLFAVRLLGAVADQSTQYLCNRLAIRVRTASIAAIFNKALRMRQNSQSGFSLGEIVNLMSVDTSNLELFLVYSYVAWSGLFHLVGGGYLCYTVSGVSSLTGFGFILVMLVANALTNQKIGTYQGQLMKIRDQRLKVVSEVLDGIKVIKLYGWEPLFSDKIIKLRSKELKVLLKIAFFGVLETFAFTASRFWMTLCILATFVSLRPSHHMDAKSAFLILNYIGLINIAVLYLPLVLKLGMKMRISIARINEFLQTEDLNESDLLRNSSEPYALKISKADFKWETSGPTILKEIELQVPPGQLVAVVGTVGSGKSSLLAAALGEMVRLQGQCTVNSTLAHVPQEAWIQNLSIRENILFGHKLVKPWYRAVVRACCLEPDLAMLPARDHTEIGEKGINLSGGQKQRVSLARAVYSQADIYLLDDPLSAVDSHVGKSIFDGVIGPRGLLNGKTRILVTHGLQWLPHVDHIYVMEDGKIKEAGTFKSLTASSKGAFAKFVTKFILSPGQVDPDDHQCSKVHRTPSSLSMEAPITNSNLQQYQRADGASPKPLVADEKLEEGLVQWRVYLDLFRAFGWRYATVTALLIFCFHCAFNTFYVLLSVWTDDSHLTNFTRLPADSGERGEKNRDYLLLLAYCGMAQTIFSLAYSTILQCRHVATSRVLHNQLLQGVMRAPISFFDTTPMGRVLNRFSQDLDSLDSFVFFFLEICVEHSLFALGILAVISYGIPKLSAVSVLTVVAVYFLQKFYSRSVCSLKRLASVNRSPVFAHFSETVSGLSVIRAQCQQLRFSLDNQVKVDRFQNPTSLAYAANKWMQFWLDMIGCLLLMVVSLYVILYREDVKPGLVGLSLSLVVAITIELKAMSQKSSELESSVVAVERIREYSGIPSEAPWDLPQDSAIEEKGLSPNNNTRRSFHEDRGGGGGGTWPTRRLSNAYSDAGGTLPSHANGFLSFRSRPTSQSPPGLTQISPRLATYGSLSSKDALKKLDPRHRPYTIANGKPFSVNDAYFDEMSSNDLEVNPGSNGLVKHTAGSANPSWPQSGHIQFVGFSCRYRKDTERVLKKISFTIKGGEKIGVVGRTGAGKSSLVLSLFRLVEADEGQIFIDDVDISTLGLHRLRQALTILPQDPVLFAGSMRENLDPSGKRSEVELWRALEQAHLKQFVQALPGQLDALVGDGGGNLSMGQRQLVCLARTLLCQTRVLVLDEATAAVDLETDSLVQATIHSAFTGCTVIAIAHRLSTILEYDRVLVLDQGTVLEFDTPKVLVDDPHSAFHALAWEAGLIDPDTNGRTKHDFKCPL